MVHVLHAQAAADRELVHAADQVLTRRHLVVLVGVVLERHGIEVPADEDGIELRIRGALHAPFAFQKDRKHLHGLHVGEPRIPVEVRIRDEDAMIAQDALELAQDRDVALPGSFEPEKITIRRQSFPDHMVNVDSAFRPRQRDCLPKSATATATATATAAATAAAAPTSLTRRLRGCVRSEVLREKLRDAQGRPGMHVELVGAVDGRAAVDAAARLLKVHPVEVPLVLHAAQDVVKRHLLHFLQAVHVRLQVQQLTDDQLATSAPVQRSARIFQVTTASWALPGATATCLRSRLRATRRWPTGCGSVHMLTAQSAP
eukprot:scaffold336_cov250-Pinguiococcus_pyrenoidosus.AAC.26